MMTTPQQRRKHIGIIIVCAAAVAYAAGTAQADTFTFGGTVTNVNSGGGGFGPPWAGVAVGNNWQITYTFDNSAPDTSAAASLGEYRAITSYNLTIGSVNESASVAPASTFILNFSGQPVGWDQYEVSIPLQGGPYDWFMQLDDSTGTAWDLAGLNPRDALPLCGDINLSWFDFKDFTLRDWHQQAEIQGSVDSFSCVPEPATLSLLALGGLALLRRRYTSA